MQPLGIIHPFLVRSVSPKSELLQNVSVH